MSDSPQLLVEWENGRGKIESEPDRKHPFNIYHEYISFFFSSPSYLSQNIHLIRLPEVKASVT